MRPQQAYVTGNLTVAFYDAAAGWTAVGPVRLAPRADPTVSERARVQRMARLLLLS